MLCPELGQIHDQEGQVEAQTLWQRSLSKLYADWMQQYFVRVPAKSEKKNDIYAEHEMQQQLELATAVMKCIVTSLAC